MPTCDSVAAGRQQYRDDRDEDGRPPLRIHLEGEDVAHGITLSLFDGTLAIEISPHENH